MMLLAPGFSLTSAPSTAVVMGSLSSVQMGTGAAGNKTARDSGGPVGAAVIGSVISSLFGPQARNALARFGLNSGNWNRPNDRWRPRGPLPDNLPMNLWAGSNLAVARAFTDGPHRRCVVAVFTAVATAVRVFRVRKKQPFRRGGPPWMGRSKP